MSAPRLLIVGEQGLSSGFERVTRGLAEALHGLGKYDVVVRGLSYSSKMSNRLYPYRVKPAMNTHDDPAGVLQFRGWIQEDEPDVVLMIHDIWHITNIVCYKDREMPFVAYFPTDCPNVKWEHAAGLGAVSQPVAYTQFGARETAAAVRDFLDLVEHHQRQIGEYDDPSIKLGWWIQKTRFAGMELNARFDRLARLQNAEQWNIIPHGYEPGKFTQMDRAYARRELGLPEDKKIILNVNSNHQRKRLDLTLRTFARVAAERDDVLLVVHCAGGDASGWDLMQLARHFGLAGKVIFPHHQVAALSDEHLNLLYNAADVQINTAGGEGWGLPAFEGAACGIPQFVPDWSATRELWQDHGVLFKVKDFQSYPLTLNTQHAIIDPEWAGEAIIRVLGDRAEYERLSACALEQAKRQFSWQDIGLAFDTVIEKALNEPTAAPLSFNDIREMRRGELESETRGVVRL